MDGFLWDLRYGWRGLWRSPVFTAVSALTLALGIGANTAIFSMLDEVLLRPLPVHRPDELVRFVWLRSSGPADDFSYPAFQDIAGAGGGIRDAFATSILPVAMSVDGVAERALGEQVSGNYFGALGVVPVLGRPLTAEDDRVGGAPVAVLSYDVWQHRFAGQPGVIGQTVGLDRATATVVGVAPRGFRGTTRGLSPSFWTSLRTGEFVTRDDQALIARTTSWLQVFARVAPAARAAAADAPLGALKAARDPVAEGARLGILPAQGGATGLVEGPRRLGRLLMAVVLLLVTIACANVAGLLLARTEGRRREIAIRLALGGGPRRVARQFLCESLLLSAIGGLLALLLAQWAIDGLRSFSPPSPFPLDLHFSLDGRVLLFTATLTLVTAVAFGLAPALQVTRAPLLDALRRDSGSGWWRRGTMNGRRFLVAGQVALSVVTLTAAGLFLRTLINERAVPVGFDPRNRVTVSFDLGGAHLDRERAAIFYRQVAERVRALPGVQAVSFTQYLPPSPGGSRWGFGAGELGIPTLGAIDIDVNSAGGGFFRTMGIAMREGRDFNDQDGFSSQGTLKGVVNQAFAEQAWPGASPLGRLLPLYGPHQPPVEIVGVVGDGRYRQIREDRHPYLYLSSPIAQSRDLAMVVHADRPAGPTLGAVLQVVREVEPRAATFHAVSLEQHVSEAMVESRFATLMLGAFGAMALALTCIGLYGLMAYAVERRTKEIGLRLALGATPSRVLRMVARESAVLVVPGLLAGVGLSLLLSRWSRALLFGVAPFDPPTYAVSVALLTLALACAVWVPGRHASRLEPMVALREE